jgi:hypothetical protein
LPGAAQAVVGRPRRSSTATPPQTLRSAPADSATQVASAPRRQGPPEAPPYAPRRRLEPESKGQGNREDDFRQPQGSGRGFWDDDEEPQGRNPRLTAASRVGDIAEVLRQPQAAPQKSRLAGMMKTLGRSQMHEANKVKATQDQIGLLLASLLNGDPGDQKNIDDLHASIKKMAAGGDSDSKFRQLAEEFLNDTMKVGELQLAHKTLANLITNGSADPHVKLFQDAAARVLERCNPALSPDLHQVLHAAISLADREGMAEFLQSQYLQAMGIAAKLIASDNPATVHAVVMDAIASIQKPGNVAAFFMLAVPGSVLGAMANVAEHEGFAGRERIVQIARDCLAAKRTEARRNLDTCLDDLQSWAHNESGAVRDAPALATAVENAANELAALRSFGDSGAALRHPPEVLKHLLQPFNLQQLSLAQLKTLPRALEALGLKNIGRAIEAELTARKSGPLEMHAANVIESLLALGTGGDLYAALLTLKHARDALKGSGVLWPRLIEQLKPKVAGMPYETRRKLADVMTHQQVGELCSALRELRRMRQVQGYDALLGELHDLEEAVVAVRTAALASLGRRAKTSSAIIPRLETLSAEVRTALSACGIEIGTGDNIVLRAGIASMGVQHAIKENLAGMLARSDAEFGALPNLRSRLDVPGDLPQDVALLRTLSRIISLRSMAGVDAALASPDGPVTLPDGTPCELLGERESTFSVRSDGKGGVFVRCSLAVPQVQGFRTAAQGPLARKEIGAQLNGSARFSYEIAVSPQGFASVSTPIDFVWTAQQNPWPEYVRKPYPKPANAAQALEGHPQLAEELREFLDKEHSSENYLVIDDLNAFRAKPELAAAQDLVRKYISQNADTPVNVGGPLRTSIEAEIANAQAADSVTPALVDLFDQARHEIFHLLSRDTLQRFLRSVDATELAAADAARAASASQPAAVEAQSQPVRDPALRRKTQALVGARIELLSEVLMNGDKFKATAALLPRSRPPAVTEDAYWSEYTEHVKLRLGKLQGAQLASLQFNLESALNPSERDEPYVRVIHLAVIDELKRHREGRMTLESVVLKAALPGQVNARTLTQWLASSPPRVSAEDVKESLVNLPVHKLRTMAASDDAGAQLRNIVEGLIVGRRTQIESMELDLIAMVGELNAPAWLADPTGELARMNMHSLFSLALRFGAYATVAGEARFSREGHALQVQEQIQHLAQTLQALFGADRFEGDQWEGRDLARLSAALTTLGAGACEPKLQGILRLRELAREEELRDQNELRDQVDDQQRLSDPPPALPIADDDILPPPAELPPPDAPA